MKRVIQTYKSPGRWVNDPPGVGDFVRGTCDLFEKLQNTGMELRIDVSQTGFAGLIEQNESIFQAGDETRIASASEYFDEEDPLALDERLARFRHSDETELYLCSNLGAWDRLTLAESTRAFIGKFYRFNNEVERLTAEALQARRYEVLSVRCGDRYYSDPAAQVNDEERRRITSIIERHVLPRATLPVAVTSDCHELKVDLGRRYGMMNLPHRSQHGAFGNVLPVAMDMCMLKNARFIYHINIWADWWSGFSHYTSLAFTIPSMNFRAPHFAKEEITAQGQLVKSGSWLPAFMRA